MNSFSEQDSIDPDNPKLDYTPLGLSERAAKLGPSVSQRTRSEPIRSPPMSRPALLGTKAISKPAGRTRNLDQPALLSIAARVAVVAGVVALLFMIMKPASRQSVAGSTQSDTTGSTPLSKQGNVESTAALAELNAPVASPPGQPAAHQPQQLLQRFLQWREKANTTEVSQ